MDAYCIQILVQWRHFMATATHSFSDSPRQLSELTAILRAIAHDRKGAASALRRMAEDYEIAATGSVLADRWHQDARG